MTDPKKLQQRPTVKVAEPTYQPSRTELEADLRVDATFEQAVKALAKDVNVRHVKVHKGG